MAKVWLPTCLGQCALHFLDLMGIVSRSEVKALGPRLPGQIQAKLHRSLVQGTWHRSQTQTYRNPELVPQWNLTIKPPCDYIFDPTSAVSCGLLLSDPSRTTLDSGLYTHYLGPYSFIRGI